MFLNRLVQNDSVVDMLSAACSDADDEVYRLVQQLYDLTLDTSDWRCEAVRSDYSGIELQIYHISCQLASNDAASGEVVTDAFAWDSETMRRCADHLVMATPPTADDSTGLLELQTNASAIFKAHTDQTAAAALE